MGPAGSLLELHAGSRRDVFLEKRDPIMLVMPGAGGGHAPAGAVQRVESRSTFRTSDRRTDATGNK